MGVRDILRLQFEVILNVRAHSLFVENSRGFRSRCGHLDVRDPNRNKQPGPPANSRTGREHRTSRKAPSDKSHPSHFLDPLPFHSPLPPHHPQTQTMTIFGPLGPSLAGYVRSSKTLSSWLKPVSLWYANLAGYRRMGLRYDDLRTSGLPSPPL